MGVHKWNGLLYGSIFFIGLWIVSGIFFAVYTYIRTKDRRMAVGNANMSFWLCFFGALCMWITWVCAFMH